MDKTIKGVIAGVALLLTLIVAASYVNSCKYYLEVEDGVVEIWQGRFAPLGKKLVDRLPGLKAPEALKDVYARAEVFNMAFGYYMEKADAMMAESEVPNLEMVRKVVKHADCFAVTDEAEDTVDARMAAIKMFSLLYQADLLLSKGTVADYESALKPLNKAAALKLDDAQTDMVTRRIEMVNGLIASAKTAAEVPAEKLEAAPAAEEAAPVAAETAEAAPATEETTETK